MHLFESRHIKNAPIKPKVWKRYIDDILAIFECTDEELKEFETWLNTLHPTIKFTMNSDPQGIEFLDTYLSNQGGKIVIKPFTKPTDTKQYVEPSSCHPPHTIKSIPYSQALRLQRICTHRKDLNSELKNMYGYFKNRNYPEPTIAQGINRALKGNKKPRGKSIPTTMVITYNPRNPNYAKAINQTWMKFEKKLEGKQSRPLVCYKRPRNPHQSKIHGTWRTKYKSQS